MDLTGRGVCTRLETPTHPTPSVSCIRHLPLDCHFNSGVSGQYSRSIHGKRSLTGCAVQIDGHRQVCLHRHLHTPLPVRYARTTHMSSLTGRGVSNPSPSDEPSCERAGETYGCVWRDSVVHMEDSLWLWYPYNCLTRSSRPAARVAGGTHLNDFGDRVIKRLHFLAWDNVGHRVYCTRPSL